MSFSTPAVNWRGRGIETRLGGRSYKIYERELGGVTSFYFDERCEHYFLVGAEAGDTYNIYFKPHSLSSHQSFNSRIHLVQNVSGDESTTFNFIPEPTATYGAVCVVNDSTNGSAVTFSGPYPDHILTFSIEGNIHIGYLITQHPHYDFTGNLPPGPKIITGGTNISVVGADPSWTINKDVQTISAGDNIFVGGADPSWTISTGSSSVVAGTNCTVTPSTVIHPSGARDTTFTIDVAAPVAGLQSIGYLDVETAWSNPLALSGNFYVVNFAAVSGSAIFQSLGNDTFFAQYGTTGIQYIGTQTKLMRFTILFDINVTAAATLPFQITCHIYKNGVDQKIHSCFFERTNTDVQQVNMMYIDLAVAQNDYFELYLRPIGNSGVGVNISNYTFQIEAEPMAAL